MTKRSRTVEPPASTSRASAPPPPEYLEEQAAANGEEDDDDDDYELGDQGDQDGSDEFSASLEDTSSNSNLFDTSDNDGDSDGDCADEDLAFLNVERPKCTWFALKELFYREHGLSGNGRRSVTGRDPQMFKMRLCGSLNVVQRLELMYKLERHDGCVNSLNFSPDGKLLASGSDDRSVVIWNWASNSVAHTLKSGHHSNVFQTKFYGGTSSPDINIVTSARDGLVRSITVPSSGGQEISTTLFKHIGAVHRIAIVPQSPYEILTAGEDGMVVHVDMRTQTLNRLATVKFQSQQNTSKRKLILYGIATNPIRDEFCVYGQHREVRIYDRRNTKTPCKVYYPQDLPERSVITSATYNGLGSEIIASYSDDDIYLFDRNDEAGAFQNRFRGHCNSRTIKGVNFYGANSEWIVSGSDCGNIFFWSRNGSIVQWMQGDENGAINVLEPHPEFPILATSGLDSDVKIWVPSNEKPTDIYGATSGLERCVRRNMRYRQKALAQDHFDEEMFNLVVNQRLSR